jgi:hypothetical protein
MRIRLRISNTGFKCWYKKNLHALPVTLLFGLVLGSLHHLEETTPLRGAVVELLRVALAKQARKIKFLNAGSSSVADPKCLSRIPNLGSDFFHLGSRIRIFRI